VGSSAGASELTIEWAPPGCLRGQKSSDCPEPPGTARTEARLAKGSRTKMWSHPQLGRRAGFDRCGHKRQPVARSRRNVVTPQSLVDSCSEASGIEEYP
jgi:hypothetical protein